MDYHENDEQKDGCISCMRLNLKSKMEVLKLFKEVLFTLLFHLLNVLVNYDNEMCCCSAFIYIW